MQRMMAVLEFPPREDLKIFVRGEFLKGIIISGLPYDLRDITY